MKRTLVVAGIGAAITLSSLVGAGAASASTESFLQEMDNPFATHAELLAEGNAICAAFTEGRTQNLTGPASASIIGKINNYYASRGNAASFTIRMMTTAVTELCPVNSNYMMAAARAWDTQVGE
jgi:hypothetical protein